MRSCPRARRRCCVATGPDDGRGPVLARQRADVAPCAREPHDRAPVLPRTIAIQRMEIEQTMRKTRRWQHIALDATTRANEVRARVRVESLHCASDRESRVQVATGPAAREQNSHARACASVTGSLAVAPTTRS